ncbi:DNA methyltransferase [Galbitalea sp. SE-J8]|uniref:DNA methyltransferase n=1 Tax=Galbitalea sp. SE-J8 TaxID=3054952 RepID=UPI00259CF67B|nr:DNA methyltransferase [Galbitalea sp. SE-J8]MDM4761912.1 DNA methyltransferase [Galbitalea sp. SE-J8]
MLRDREGSSVIAPYYEDGGLQLFHGDSRIVLAADENGYDFTLGYGTERAFPDASFDSVVCDPPYELGFMGKGWDSTGIAYDVDLWREVLRVLKPGGHLLAFGASRTWHRLAAAIEDAGFEIRDSIAWLFGSGFPKSLDVAKAIDKDAGHWRGWAGAIESANGAMSGSNYERTGKGSPITADAAEWEGWGTALKPAFEPIVVGRKPLAGTVAATVLAYGTGALNIAAARVGDEVRHAAFTSLAPASGNRLGAPGTQEARRGTQGEPKEYVGRWPTNVVLDDSQAASLDEQTGVLKSGMMRAGQQKAGKAAGILGEFKPQATLNDTYGDAGGASRFFPTFHYEAKAPGSERPNVDGVEHATVKPLDLMRWCVRLVTRRGGRVLDLFAGSGTTGEAALLEGMDCTLIEYEADHLPLILQRVRKPLTPSLFGDIEGIA